MGCKNNCSEGPFFQTGEIFSRLAATCDLIPGAIYYVTEDDGEIYQYTALADGCPYIVNSNVNVDNDKYVLFSAAGLLDDGEVLPPATVGANTSILVNSSKNTAVFKVAPTAAMDIKVKLEDVTIITYSFTAGNRVATAVTGSGSGAVWEAGETLEAVGPVTADATASGLSVLVHVQEI